MITTLPKPEPKADSNRTKQTKAKQRGTPSIMISYRSPFLDLVDTPNVQSSAVAQGQAGNNGESPRSGKSKRVTKVEERGSNGTNEDGEFEPGEEGTFSG